MMNTPTDFIFCHQEYLGFSKVQFIKFILPQTTVVLGIMWIHSLLAMYDYYSKYIFIYINKKNSGYMHDFRLLPFSR